MALIHNSFGSLFGGVSQQPATERQLHQVEEMVNCVPTIDSGLLKRNPMAEVDTGSISLNENTFSYEYDRGYSLNTKERYSLQISQNEAATDIKVVNLSTGSVYSDGSGLTFEGDAKEYIANFAGVNGYAGTTIKDTTFLTNKDITPRLYVGEEDPDASLTQNRDYVTVEFLNNGNISGTLFSKSYSYTGYAPSIVQSRTGIFSGTRYNVLYPVSTLLTVKGIEIRHRSFAVPVLFVKNNPIKMDEWLNVMIDKTQRALGEGFRVSRANATAVNLPFIPMRIESLDPSVSLAATDISVSYYDIPVGSNYSVFSDVYYDTSNSYVNVVNLREEELAFREYGYVWLKSANPASAYTYTARVKVLNTSTQVESFVTASASATTSTAAATTLATNLRAIAEIDSDVSMTIAIGSTVQIHAATGYEILDVDASDTFGDQATSGWANTIQSINDLPQNFPFGNALVQITGFDSDERNDYWVKRTGGIWQEWYDPEVDRRINPATMPHVLVKDNDGDAFTFRQFDGWNEMLVGDHITNAVPSFLYSEEAPDVKIKDIFFFKNRLGFITDRTIIMSEVGQYGNFWRTSVVSLLDSDRIDGVVDTNKAIKLEYVSNLEDILVLFAGSAQFKVSGGEVLSPKSIQASQASAYDINLAARPVFMNNEIFFCTTRGDYTQVMKYRLSELAGKNIIAEDVTMIAPRYIGKDITSFTFSSVNNMLFLTVVDEPDSIYVYKYMRSGQEVVQAAWFKWKVQADVYKVFSFSDKLYLLTATFDDPDPADWLIQDGTWDSSGVWYSTAKWRSSPSSIAKTSKIQEIDIFNNLADTAYLDNETTPYLSEVDLGEWVFSNGGQKEPRGHLKVKTIEIDSESGSEFSLVVSDVNRNTIRFVEAKNTVGRKPMIYGDSENVRLSIRNQSTTGLGFKINNVSLEGQFNIRSSRR
jgi:hypothetical protein